jgi:hypothetical protein
MQIWPEFCMTYAASAARLRGNTVQAANVWMSDNRAKGMKQDNGNFGLLVGGLVALAAMIFIFSGGELGGKTVIYGDQDLPPIALADQ